MIARGGGAPLAVLANIVIARLLGTNGYGQYMTLLSAGLLVGGISTFGTGPVCTREIAIQRGAAQQTAIGMIACWALRFTSIISILTVSVLLIWFAFCPAAPESTWPQRIAVVWIVPTSVWAILVVSILIGMGRVAKSQMIQNVWKNGIVLVGATILMFVGIRNNVVALLFVQVMAFAGAAAVGLWWIRRARSTDVPQGFQSRDFSLELSATALRTWRFSAGLFFAGTLATLLLDKVDVLIVNAVGGQTMAGIFAAAARLGQLAGVSGLVWTAWLQPRMAYQQRQRSGGSLRRLLRMGVIGNVSITTIIVVLGWLFADQIMALLGSGFGAAVAPFRWLLAGYLVWSISIPFYVFLSMSGKEALVARIFWIQVVVTVTLSIPLITHFGALGGAWAWSGGMTLAGVLFIVFGFRWYARKRPYLEV